MFAKGKAMARTSDAYSVAQVAAMLMLAAELYMRATSPVRAEPRLADLPPGRVRKCQKCDRDIHGDECVFCKAPPSPEVLHADVLRRLGLSDADRETLLIGLADLDMAMRRVRPLTRQGIADYVERGPFRIEKEFVEFRMGHSAHVVTVWRSINRSGEFAPSDAKKSNVRQGIGNLHAA